VCKTEENGEWWIVNTRMIMPMHVVKFTEVDVCTDINGAAEMTIIPGSLLLCKRWGRQHVGRGSTAQKKRRNRHQANPSFYFVFPFRFSAQRFFIRSDSFFRPAAVRRFPPFCLAPELCLGPTGSFL